MPTAPNPVFRAELKHQRYVIESSRAGWVWILLALLLLLPALAASLLYSVAVVVGIEVLEGIDSVLLEVLATLLVIMNIALYVVVSLITIGLAASSIQREIDGRTWETLLLTGIPAWQIVRGKWRATLWALWGDHIMLVVLRWGLLAAITVTISQFTNPGQPPDVAGFLTGAALVALFTGVDALLSAALGLITPLSGYGNVLLLPALVLRLLLTVGLVVIIVVVEGLLPEMPAQTAIAVLIGIGSTILLTWLFLYLAEQATRLHAVLQPAR